jgi:hypothetical protein
MATTVLINETAPITVEVNEPTQVVVEISNEQGPVGPANSLSIGTVTTVQPPATASATITGTAPIQTLSLNIPQGPAATVTVGTTTTSNPGTNATVTNAGTTGAAVLNFTIPRGDPGDLTQVIADTRYVQLSGSTMTGKLTLDGDPSSALHAATKQYVDNLAEGLHAAPSARAATTTNLDATYNNGTLGVGATLTASSNGAWVGVDGITTGAGYTWSLYQGVLVKNQSNNAHNGRYFISNLGSVSTPWVLTRCTFCDTSQEVPGTYVFVEDGTTNKGKGYVALVENPATFTIGTDYIVWTQFSGPNLYTAGTGIDISGSNVISVLPEALLPSQTGNAGKYLTTDGSDASWATIVTDPTPTVFLLGGM